MSAPSDSRETVLVPLLDEGTPTWLITPATKIAPNAFLLHEPENYDPDDYTMEFAPGTRVVCERKTIQDGSEHWAAVAIWKG